MFQLLLSFLLINSYYQSLGLPMNSNHSMVESLTNLSRICQNQFLVNAIKNKLNDCDVPVPSVNKKSIQCLIFFDINHQLCSAQLPITDDFMPKIHAKQDVTALCTQAKDWVFTNITKFDHYKNKLEDLFKTPITCGDICGTEDNILEANDFCKYYKWGIELLKSQVSTTSNTMNNNIVESPVSKTDSEDPIGPVKSSPVNSEASSTNNQKDDVKLAESSDIPKAGAEKQEESVDVNEQNVVSEKLPNPINNQENGIIAENNDDLNSIGNELENPLKQDIVVNEQGSKSTQTTKPISGGQSDPVIGQVADSGKDKVELDPAKDIDKDDGKVDGKAQGDLEYPESDGGDDDNEMDDSQIDVNPEKKEFTPNKLPSKIDYNSHKEFYPNTSDGFTDDGDHFFPFFLTGIILVVLLYVLYHNKSKVSKVFFGLLVEGRQNGRRRNSRGHAYRRLDTLEQAMSANTAAPPSKIIY